MSITRRLALAAFIIGGVIPFAANAGTFTTLYAFTGGSDGGGPQGQLVYRYGMVYGVTPGYYDNDANDYGNVFAVNVKTGTLEIIYKFQGGTNGRGPNDLIYHAGVFYGTTLYGGTGCGVNGCGTVFALDAKTGKQTVLYSFPDPGNNFQPDPGGLIYESGTLYGVATYSGNNNDGVVFAINPSTDAETTVFNFDAANGFSPNQSLIFKYGFLYGTTKAGGGNSCKMFNDDEGCGVAFNINPSTGAERVLYAFAAGTGGFLPTSNLVNHAGTLYGSTEYGGDMSCGRYGCGTFFSVNAGTGEENVVNANTGLPQIITSLSEHGNSIYETLRGTFRGHHISFGELVKFDTGSRQTSMIHKFTNGADGSHPYAPLTFNSGAYYGTTTAGANSGCVNDAGCGTVFQYVP